MTESHEKREFENTEAPPSPPVPHGPRLRFLAPAVVLIVLALVVGVIWSEGFRNIGRRFIEAVAPAHEEETAGPVQYYTCGMDPQVILPEPGLCPICHMELVPLDPSKLSDKLKINPDITQNIGVRVAPVVTGTVTSTVRTVGTVDYDETHLAELNLKVSGWVEKLYVNTVGQAVEKGQPLLELYSPELYSAQEEYLAVYKRASVATKSGDPVAAEMASMNADLLAAARKRLEYFDISADDIRRLEQSGTAAKTMTLRSPFRGTVVARNVVEGQKADVGMSLVQLADLSKVWIMATVYEYQLPFVEVGQKAIVALSYLPDRTFEGKVAYIYPTLNEKLRQAKVRLEFENPQGLLKPGMFASVQLERTLPGDRILVPREAVIDTGERKVAYVSLGEGRFDPRNVKTGVEAEGGKIEVLSGLAPGEMVVTSGEFLLDSEARLRESLARMVKGTLAAEEKATATSAASTATPGQGTATSAAAGRFINTRCPIMGTPIDPEAVPDSLIRQYKGHNVAFCCPGCPAQWDALSDAQKDSRLTAAGVNPALLGLPARTGTVPRTAPKSGAMPPMPGM
jgi:RND family efflux transporter MFP subunit